MMITKLVLVMLLVNVIVFQIALVEILSCTIRHHHNTS